MNFSSVRIFFESNCFFFPTLLQHVAGYPRKKMCVENREQARHERRVCTCYVLNKLALFEVVNLLNVAKSNGKINSTCIKHQVHVVVIFSRCPTRKLTFCSATTRVNTRTAKKTFLSQCHNGGELFYFRFFFVKLV